jgi:hypothetical protein
MMVFDIVNIKTGGDLLQDERVLLRDKSGDVKWYEVLNQSLNVIGYTFDSVDPCSCSSWGNNNFYILL